MYRTWAVNIPIAFREMFASFGVMGQEKEKYFDVAVFD
jgi:hypothetical protein